MNRRANKLAVALWRILEFDPTSLKVVKRRYKALNHIEKGLLKQELISKGVIRR